MRGVVAFTDVVSALTYLCRRFAYLNDQQAAIYIIHEALHHPDLTQRLQDSDAMTSWAINRVVVVACHFQPLEGCLPWFPDLDRRHIPKIIPPEFLTRAFLYGISTFQGLK